jgi:hypothetical protein
MAQDGGHGYTLLHPVYLDVPMMVSFLAHLEGGLVVEEEQTSKHSGARERLLKGRAGLRARFGPLPGVDAGVEGSTQRKDEESVESKTSRHHTAASLFNLLYDYLTEDEQLVTVEGPEDLSSLRAGQLVELGGEYLGNPLEESLALISSFLPYLQAQKDAQEQAPKKAIPRPKRNANQRASSQEQAQADLEAAAVAAIAELTQQAEAQASELGTMMMTQMAADIKGVPVHDVLIRTEGGVDAVLTVDSSFYSATTNEYLRAGEFRIVGKITRVLRDERTINLTRRTVMGAARPEVARDMLASLSNGELSLDLADPIVSAPGIQVLPMAIFL